MLGSSSILFLKISHKECESTQNHKNLQIRLAMWLLPPPSPLTSIPPFLPPPPFPSLQIPDLPPTSLPQQFAIARLLTFLVRFARTPQKFWLIRTPQISSSLRSHASKFCSHVITHTSKFLVCFARTFKFLARFAHHYFSIACSAGHTSNVSSFLAPWLNFLTRSARIVFFLLSFVCLLFIFCWCFAFFFLFCVFSIQWWTLSAPSTFSSCLRSHAKHLSRSRSLTHKYLAHTHRDYSVR